MNGLVEKTILILLLMTTNSHAQQTKKDTSPPPSKPKFSAPTTKPKFGAPEVSDKKSDPKPKFSAPDGKTSNDQKPRTDPAHLSQKAQAAKEARSERKYQESVKASQPPKQKYTTSDGKQVEVRTAGKTVETIRNQPSTILQPEVRREVAVKHIHHYNYHHDYNWYSHQPVVYVGGGYSSAFWWMMSEWSAERRAMWLYHNRYHIEQDAYERGLRDAEVSRRVAELENRRVAINPDYVDQEFVSDPSIMYDQHYLEAAYNPTAKADPEAALAVLKVLGCLTLVGVVMFGFYYLVFVARWGR